MEITAAGLEALRVGYNASFQEGFDTVEVLSDRIAEPVPSTTGENLYPWLEEIPGLREWVGDRVIHSMAEDEYRIKNLPFEHTIGVDRYKILDDQFGIYNPRFRMQGRAAALWRETLIWDTLKAATIKTGYDKQPYFDSAHPVIAENGAVQPVSNIQVGAGPMWYLMATTGPVLPLIRQTRQEPDFVAMDDRSNERVFMKREFLYGVEARGNGGYAFWQTAFASSAPLTAANYEIARTAITSGKADYGRPLGLVPNLLIVPPTLEGAANKVVRNQLVDGGNTNEWAGTAEVLMVPYLS